MAVVTSLQVGIGAEMLVVDLVGMPEVVGGLTAVVLMSVGGCYG